MRITIYAWQAKKIYFGTEGSDRAELYGSKVQMRCHYTLLPQDYFFIMVGKVGIEPA